MKLRDNTLLNILHFVTWLGFIGLCIETSGILIAGSVSFFADPNTVRKLYMGNEVLALAACKLESQQVLTVFAMVTAILHVYLFLILLQIFKKVNFVTPFHHDIRKLIERLSAVAVAAGVVSNLTLHFAAGGPAGLTSYPKLLLTAQTGDAFLLFGGILFFMSVLYKKGIALQQESDLTV